MAHKAYYYNEIIHKKQPMKMLLHILQPCSNKNCNMQMIG